MSLQENLRKISGRFQRLEMSFNVNKCHILQIGKKNIKCDKDMNGTKIESVQCVKDLAVTVEFRLKFSDQYEVAAGKADRMLGYINRNFSFKDKDIMLPLYISLVRPHLEDALQFSAAHHSNDTAKLEDV